MKNEQTQLAQWFNNIVVGKNIMTPYVEQYLRNGDLVAEISSGTGIWGKPLYGVTVVNILHKKHMTDLSSPFNSLDECIEYFNNL